MLKILKYQMSTILWFALGVWILSGEEITMSEYFCVWISLVLTSFALGLERFWEDEDD